MSGKWISYREVALRPLGESATYARRRQGQLAAVRAHVDRSARPLHARWHALERCGKRRTVITVAVARANSPGTARRSQPCSTA
jgi:hypothetical protein